MGYTRSSDPVLTGFTPFLQSDVRLFGSSRTLSQCGLPTAAMVGGLNALSFTLTRRSMSHSRASLDWWSSILLLARILAWVFLLISCCTDCGFLWVSYSGCFRRTSRDARIGEREAGFLRQLRSSFASVGNAAAELVHRLGVLVIIIGSKSCSPLSGALLAVIEMTVASAYFIGDIQDPRCLAPLLAACLDSLARMVTWRRCYFSSHCFSCSFHPRSKRCHLRA